MEYAHSHADAPRAADTRSRPLLRRRLAAVRDRLTSEHGPLDAPPLDDVVDAFAAFGTAVSIVDSAYLDRLLASGPCVFEGAQGVLLDEWRGWHPYTTWSTTTFDNALETADVFRLGVVRTHTTRHGPGPLVTEADLGLREAHNGTGEWQGEFRFGDFDAVAHRYAIEVAGGVDALAVTHLDRPPRGICTWYELDGERWDRIVPGPRQDLRYQAGLTALLSRARPGELYRPDDWAAEIGELLDAPVLLESFGPRTCDNRSAVPAARAGH
jgi:adenylosuccinate synthase